MVDDNAGMAPDQGIAELIATPGDVDLVTLKKHFPFINKVMALGNLTQNDVLDIKDLSTIKNIQKRSGMTRLQKTKYNRLDFTESRAYLTAELSLGVGGFAVKKITESTSNVYMNQPGGMRRGLLGGVFNKGGSQE